ncbi:MAG: ferrochelatase [Thiogranum sp.]|nr:ferrochelatase [Thiogranum sp.]
MTRYQGDPQFRHDAPPRTGVLMVNLGTPEAPTTAAVRRYLAEFLWDPRVVEMARPLWWLVLHGVILRIRPARVAKAYQAVWTEEGSPLMAISRRQEHALQQRLKADDGSFEVALAMRYGQPSIEHALNALREKGLRRLLVLPMYPQYSATTTAAVFDEVFRVLSRWRWVPELRLIQHYPDHPGYIDALASSVREHWQREGRPDRLMMSFHGIPRRYLLAGDPYHCECHTTARLLAEKLELGDGEWMLTFQSRFGREEWLQPYTDFTLRDWGRAGVARVDVICPGFSADCLETLEEIAGQDRELFIENGGQSLRYIPALNDRPDHIDSLAGLVAMHTREWGAADPQEEQLAMRLQRARALGARR